MEFQWDDANLRHFFIDNADRAITPTTVSEVAAADPVLFDGNQSATRSGSHKMIGPNSAGRMITVVLLHLEGESYRPITGWPSTNKETRQWKDAL